MLLRRYHKGEADNGRQTVEGNTGGSKAQAQQGQEQTATVKKAEVKKAKALKG